MLNIGVGLLKGNQERLIIVLNKIDTINSVDDDLFDESCCSVDDLQAQIQASVMEATGIDFPLSSVLVVSGKWALTSSMLCGEENTDEDSSKLVLLYGHVQYTLIMTYRC